MDFTIPRHVEAIAHRVRQFLDDEVIPLETELLRSGVDLNEDILQGLRAKAKPANLWAPTMPKEWGGMGLNIQEIVPVFEAAGRSMLGPLGHPLRRARRRQYAPAAQLGERSANRTLSCAAGERRDLLRLFHDRTAARRRQRPAHDPNARHPRRRATGSSTVING